MKKQTKKLPKIESDLKNITKEEIEIAILKSKIEMAKTGFDRYVEVLTRSAFIETCTGGAFFNKMYWNLLKNANKHADEADIPEKKKDELRKEWFFGVMFGTNSSEKSQMENELKYCESLESWAKHNLTSLNEDLKKKIIIDSIEQQELWFKQSARNFKLYKQLEEFEKTPTTKTKKTKQKIK